MRPTAFVILLAVVGCAPTTAPVPEGAKIQVVDSLQRTVGLPAPAKKIVCLAPSNTELLFALGLDAEIVGVTEFCTFPEAATKKPRIGGFASESFNLEAIAALKPDLVLASGSFQQPAIDALDKLGLTVAAFDAHSIAEVYTNIEKIGLLTTREEAARTVVGDMKKRMAAVADRVKDKPRPNVLYLVSDAPLMTVGRETVISEALELAGGTNVFADATGQYPRISDEELLRRNPQVILLPRYGHAGRAETPKILDTLTAVKEKRVYVVDADRISRQTPRLCDAVERMAELLHPTR